MKTTDLRRNYPYTCGNCFAGFSTKEAAECFRDWWKAYEAEKGVDKYAVRATSELPVERRGRPAKAKK